MTSILSDSGLDLIFRQARTHRAWLDRPVPDVTLRAIYDLMRQGPTSANGAPARLLFLKTEAAKQRLAPALSSGNFEQTMTAPVTVIVAHDLNFHEKLGKLYPENPKAPSWFGKPEVAAEHAFRNGAMQGAYMIVAARALGLDCGPMSGFDREKVDAEFFPGGALKANFLCNLGFGDPSALRPRRPRLDFDEACSIL